MEQTVSFLNARREQIAGALHVPDIHNRGGVVLGHCFTCSRHTRILRDVCDRLADEGFMALRFDFSGNGRSQGDFAETSYSKHVEEMIAAIAVLREKGAEWIGLAGHSMGAAIGLIASRAGKARAVGALAGRYTELNADRLLDDLRKKELLDTGRITFTSRGRNLELGTGFFEDATRYDLASIVAGLRIPVLAVHGDRDEIAPVEEALRAARTNPRYIETRIVEGADHMFSAETHRRIVAGFIAEWFNERRKEDSKEGETQAG